MATKDYRSLIQVLEVGDSILIKSNMRDFVAEDLHSFVEIAEEIIKEQRSKFEGQICTLSDISGIKATPEMSKIMQDFGKRIHAYIDLQMLVGVTGFKKALLKIHNTLTKSNVMPFDTEDAALAYMKKL